jgi:NADH-quinone oxidoreductase subunit N
MSASFIPTTRELIRFAPEMLLVLAATLIMVLEPLTGPAGRRKFGGVAIGALLGAILLSVVAAADPGPAFSSLLLIDAYSTFFRVLVMAVGVLIVLISSHYLRVEEHETGEYYALLLFAVVGQALMAASNELIMLFIGLECSSIASYVLAGYLREDKRNNESALKYFLLGSFATAFLLYGVAWIYGSTGTTNLATVRRVLADPQAHTNLTAIGAATALLFVGLAFKVSAAPFQVWAPDVYQGAAAPVAAFLSVGAKAAAFAMFLRIVATVFAPLSALWEPLLWLSALATMVIGNFAALRQTNIKRMLAYSSIAHAGYVMVALTAGSAVGVSAAMFYLAGYAAMNIGAFAVVTHVGRRGERFVEIADFAGLSQRQPIVAALMGLFLLSLTGIPLTAGFFGKFYIFKAALDSHLLWLAVLGMLNSAVGAYYYLRVIVVMYMQSAPEAAEELPAPATSLNVALWATALATVALGVWPTWLLDYARQGAALLR